MIQIVAIGHIVLGLALPFLMKLKTFSNFMVSQIFANLQLSEPIHNQAAYLIGVFGPTVASWGLLLLILCNSYFANPTQRKWLGLFLSVLVWFIGDTIYSLMHGISMALYLNCFVAIVLLIPLYLSRGLYDENQ